MNVGNRIKGQAGSLRTRGSCISRKTLTDTGNASDITEEDGTL